ncbi:efflux RND transporter permease subunit (plasmid) [Cytobacillus spongiae]|uniref:efflux RND transporter permease subunit n=1 Tax=Cytobacillus spongiae TaxID=2901381 RepID=UPI001CD2C131|nr:efflux RND transporter permease subunit [Cytobacillus spongiae]MCA1062608.1 efflux RND transporter permease subunit [Rossellomorea aquimaris]UII58247.1 efflux RND transporter permease subunit [Cytobacillus spongiae]WJV28724.1 efflux RND transporter permease subunit [Rossellomorea sp. AcN35-11]
MLKAILNRSKITLIFVLLFVIIGIFTFFQLPQREIPETTVNIGTVSTVYPGATVDSVERTVTNPIESSLQSIDGIKEISSSSAAGFSTIIVEVKDGENKKEVFGDVRQAVSDASTSFPDEVFDPEINESTVKMPIVSYHLTSDNRESLLTLREEMSRWEKEVEDIAGVSSVTVKGLPEEEIVIELKQDELKASALNPSSVMNAINDEFYPTPLGKQEVDNEVVQLTVDHFSSLEEMNEIFVGKNLQGESVFLKDIANVKTAPKEMKDVVTFEGKPSISFTAYVQSGEDIPTVDERVNEKVKDLAGSLPQDVTLEPYYSQASIVTDIFDGLFMSLAISVVAVILTTALGLTVSGAFVVALAVPISVLLGLIPLPFSGVDLNQISVIGAIIALGILVDDSIVVNDNIQRRYKLGDGALLGAVNGIKEIWISIVTSSLAIVFTFLPLVFLSGGNGAFIRALPAVLITTIIASTLVALIFVPIMRYLLYSKTTKKISDAPGLLGKPLNKLSDFYADSVLKKFSKRPFVVSAIGLVFTTAIFGLVALTPFEFFPSADREEVTVDVTLPIGTTIEETAETLADMEELLKKDEGVYETTAFAGTGLPGLFNSSLSNSGEHTGQLVARVDRENQTAQGLIDEWTDKLRTEYPDAKIFMETIQQGPPAGAPVTVTVSGPEMETLIELRDTITSEVEKLDTDLVVDNVGEMEPTVEFVPNRELLQDNGITINQISQQLRLATEGIPMKAFDNGVTKREMTLRLEGYEKEVDLSSLEIPSVSGNSDGPPKLVSLDELVTKEEKEELQLIPHIDGERAITIRAFPGDEEDYKASVEGIVKDVRKNLDNNNYSITLGGENEAQNDFFSEITILFTIVIFLVYLVIALQFNSLSLPFLVLVAVYLAIAGAILGLFVTQTPISFLAVMGMVSLTGIVVRNSVVLIEFIEQGLKNGMNVKEAVVESGRTRIRPILLTALTSIVALIPVAVSGDALFTPLAVTIISGILFSAILTLIIVPMLYLVFHRFRRRKLEV